MEETEEIQRKTKFNKKTPCDWPWKGITIDCNRNINPCCEYSVFSNKSPYGKIEDNTNLYDLWNDKGVINFRNEHSKNGRVNIDVCKNCDRQGIGFKY